MVGRRRSDGRKRHDAKKAENPEFHRRLPKDLSQQLRRLPPIPKAPPGARCLAKPNASGIPELSANRAASGKTSSAETRNLTTSRLTKKSFWERRDRGARHRRAP